MELSTTQRNAILSPAYPIRTLEPQSSQLTSSQPITPFFQRGVGSKANISNTSGQFPYSPVSFRSGSSFSSQGSSVDSWEAISSAPSSPRTPKSKKEFDDAPRLDLIPPHGLKRKDNSPDECCKRIKLPPVKLPSVYCLLPPTEKDDYHEAAISSIKSHLQTPACSPELVNSHVVPTKTLTLPPPSDDPIIQWLNLRRKESGAKKGALSQPDGLTSHTDSDIRIDLRPPPVFYREKQQYTQQSRGYSRPRQPRQQQPSPPRDQPEKKKRAKSKNEVHCNIKYSVEERDFIRYHKYEMKLSWNEIDRIFPLKFPMADVEMNRKTQGIQSIHYRDNANLPLLVNRGRVLVFEENGHVKGVEVKVRDQREDKPYYSLVSLFPERALVYDWVAPKFKQQAAELAKERAMQKAQARRDAIRRKKWIEKLPPGECACCIQGDRVRDTHKRALPPAQPKTTTSLERALL